jgi:L-serine dehydratase
MNYPSIFNDVIGPIMRGPSSSHCAAALRIGRLARDLMDGQIDEVWVAYDVNGSLATTHASQGSDMGLFAGFLGWEATDERLVGSASAIREAGITVHVQIADYGAAHPNTYKLTLANENERHEVLAISTGGGMIEVKAQRFLDTQIVSQLFSGYNVRCIRSLSPVLPVLSRKAMRVPFITSKEMLAEDEGHGRKLWELAIRYESARGNISPKRVFDQMRDIVRIAHDAVRQGIAGTTYADRLLGPQAARLQTRMERGGLLDGGILNRMILYVTAIMEVKSAMSVIVAAPTAGSCGALPGTCIGAASAMGLSEDDMTRAMLAAGLIGVFIAAHATFAAEVGGCQAECGAGSGMAAAALITLAGGTARQAVDATSLALQNVLGLVCDLVANRVEVPCLGRNVMAASNALACANMALAGFDPVIPLDEVIGALDEVGRCIPYELHCTALGGLSTTKTSKAIEKRLASP